MTRIGLALLLALAVAAAVQAQNSGYLGVRLTVLETPTACLKIEAVAPGSPADRAGLVAGDRIARLDGKDVDCSGKLPELKAGQKVKLKVLHDDEIRDLVLTAEAPPAAMVAAQQADLSRNARLAAAEAILQRLVRTRQPFVIVMDEGGEYRYEGSLAPEERELLHFYDYEVMLGPQMHKLLKPGRHDLVLTFDRTRNAYDFEAAPISDRP